MAAQIGNTTATQKGDELQPSRAKSRPFQGVTLSSGWLRAFASHSPLVTRHFAFIADRAGSLRGRLFSTRLLSKSSDNSSNINKTPKIGRHTFRMFFALTNGRKKCARGVPLRQARTGRKRLIYRSADPMRIAVLSEQREPKDPRSQEDGPMPIHEESENASLIYGTGIRNRRMSLKTKDRRCFQSPVKYYSTQYNFGFILACSKNGHSGQTLPVPAFSRGCNVALLPG